MKMLNIPFWMLLLITFGWLNTFSCNEKSKTEQCDEIAIHKDPNFDIVFHQDQGFEHFPKKVEVFEIPIYAVKCVENIKLLHAANIMAQYLDNDEDGQVDNMDVLAAMFQNRAFMVMWNEELDLENFDFIPNTIGQDLGNEETQPDYVSNGKGGAFDASLEEVWHIITHAGYAYAYPDIFGEEGETALTEAMDIARGGRFVHIPSAYPEDAWYSYDDETCDYGCMATEYIYWGMTSILGAQENRASQIGHEWKLHTKDLVQKTDTSLYTLLTDPKYKFPKKLPDGKYRRIK